VDPHESQRQTALGDGGTQAPPLVAFALFVTAIIFACARISTLLPVSPTANWGRLPRSCCPAVPYDRSGSYRNRRGRPDERADLGTICAAGSSL